MRTRRLGAGPEVSALGLGCMGMSGRVYGPTRDEDSIATIRAAIDAGVTLLDTGDFYGAGHNEMLLREALRGIPRDKYVLSVKFGAMRGPGNAVQGNDVRPAAMKNFLAYSLQRLGVDDIDIYRPARIDPGVAVEEIVGAMAEMVRAGYVRQIGLSEVGAATLRRAVAVHPISDVQIEYSLLSRGIERALLPACRELGVGVMAYGVLTRGLLSGAWSTERVIGPGDSRGRGPRFKPGNVEHNLQLVELLRAIAQARGVSVAQLAIAWVAGRGEDIVPLIGAKTRAQFDPAIAAMELLLSDDDLAAIEAAVPPGAASGTRYDSHQMEMLDSERE